MVSRRGFLKLVSSLPALASVPAVAHAIDNLPEERVLVGEVLPRSLGLPPPPSCEVGVDRPWLMVDGVPAHVKSMRLDSEQAWIPLGQVPQVIPGLRTSTLSAVLLFDDGGVSLHDSFTYQQPVELIACFDKLGEFHATGICISYSLQLGRAMEVAVEFYLKDVLWVERQ